MMILINSSFLVENCGDLDHDNVKRSEPPRPTDHMGSCVLVILWSLADLHIRGSTGMNVDLLAVPFDFSPLEFQEKGPVLLATGSDWNTTTCPPRYVGERSLQDALVLFLTRGMAEDLACPLHELVQGSQSAGARALLHARELGVLTNARPGAEVASHPSVALSQAICVDVTQSSVQMVVSALRRGEALTGTLAASHNPWEDMWSSPLWTCRQVLFVLVGLVTLELAVTRLIAFRASAGGQRLSAPEWVLVVEMVSCTSHVVFWLLDPLQSRRFVSPRTAGAVMVSEYCAHLWGTSLFFAFFLALPRDGGLAVGSGRHRVWRHWHVAGLLVSLCLLVATSLATTRGALDILVHVAVCIMAFYLCAVAWLSKVVFEAMKTDVPSLIRDRVGSRLDFAAYLETVIFLLSTVMMWGEQSPWRSFSYFSLVFGGMNMASMWQVTSFRPIGVRFKTGPVEYAVRHLFARCAASRFHPVVPLVRSPSHSMLSQAVSPHAPSPRKVPPHMLLGANLTFLRQFCLEKGADEETVTADFARVIREYTQASGLSVCEMHAQDDVASVHTLQRDVVPMVDAVGPATLFVSHAQACRLLRLFEAIEDYLRNHRLDADDCLVWLDLFSIRQHDVASHVHLIGEVENVIGRVALVLDPWDKPVALTRIWCLYEVLQTHMNPKVELNLAMCREEHLDFVRKLKEDDVGTLDALSSFDARQASAANAEDRQNILALIETAFEDYRGEAIDRFSQLVREAVRRGVAALSWEL